MDIEQIRKFCLSLPHAIEDVKWGNDLCFSIGKKMFTVGHLAEPFSVSFKVREEEFDEMSNTENIVPAPYVARYKWVQVQHPDRLHLKEWEHFLRQSYELVKARLPKKVLKELEG